jgi:Zn-dependent protease with chaperone function
MLANQEKRGMIRFIKSLLCSATPVIFPLVEGFIVESQSDLTCPECHLILPVTRQRSPWCECGWTSVVGEELLYIKVSEDYRRRLEKDNRHAHKLAELDTQILKTLETRSGRLRWRSSLIISLLLCAPFYLLPILLWVSLLVGWGYTLWLGIPALIFIASLILGGAILFHRLMKTKSHAPPGIEITEQHAPELFAIITEVATRLQVPSVKKVQLYLPALAGIRIQRNWRSAWRPMPLLGLGLLTFYALSETQLKAILAHELAHLQHRDHLASMFLDSSLRQLYELAGSQSFLLLLGIYGLALRWIIRQYLILLVRTSLHMMRRQEFMADRAAAYAYGRTPFLGGLIEIYVTQKKFNESLPIMVQNITNDLDSHNFFYQFTHQWEALTPAMREAVYARALVENRSVYDTHPSYKDRWRALAEVADFSGNDEEDKPALTLISNAAELGRELTIQGFRNWNARRYG